MWTAFPPSDYYAGSATPRANRRRVFPHPAWQVGSGERKALPRFTVNRSTGWVPNFAPATSPRVRRSLFPMASCGKGNRCRSRPAPGRASLRPSSPGFEPVRIERLYNLVPHVHLTVSLAEPAPSGGAGRPGFVRAAPAPPGVPRLRLPSASCACCDRRMAVISDRSVVWRFCAHLFDAEVHALGGTVARPGAVVVEDLEAPSLERSPRARSSGTASCRQPMIALSRRVAASSTPRSGRRHAPTLGQPGTEHLWSGSPVRRPRRRRRSDTRPGVGAGVEELVDPGAGRLASRCL